MTLTNETFSRRVARFLEESLLGTSECIVSNVEQMGVGWSHETWLFQASWNDSQGGATTRSFCLRLDPGTSLLRNMSDLGEQFRVLRCLEGTGVPAPSAYWYEEGSDVLGAPFLVMEKVPGECPSPWSQAGRKYYQAAAERGKLPLAFIEALASIHTTDWRQAGLDFLGVPQPGKGFALHQIAKWRNLIEETAYEGHPVLTDLVCWLEENAPTTDQFVLVHGAYRTGNVLVDADSVSAVLDWELQAIGDPMFDVAYVLSDLNRDRDSTLLSNLVDRDLFMRAYQELTGISIDLELCRYFQLLYAFRSAAFWISAADLYSSGRSNDLRLARTAWSIPVVLDQAARALGY